jgi:hypothetical protein
VDVDRKQFFECLKCGHFTKFDPGNRARCESCGCTTGIMVNDTASPLFRFSPQRIATLKGESRKSEVESVSGAPRGGLSSAF